VPSALPPPLFAPGHFVPWTSFPFCNQFACEVSRRRAPLRLVTSPNLDSRWYWKVAFVPPSRLGPSPYLDRPFFPSLSVDSLKDPPVTKFPTLSMRGFP